MGVAAAGNNYTKKQTKKQCLTNTVSLLSGAKGGVFKKGGAKMAFKKGG